MNKEIEKYPIYILNTAGKLIKTYQITSTEDYDHNRFALHHYIPYQAYTQNSKWYEDKGIKQKLILISHICHEQLHNQGIKQLTDEEFKQKYKISKWKLIFNRKYSDYE